MSTIFRLFNVFILSSGRIFRMPKPGKAFFCAECNILVIIFTFSVLTLKISFLILLYHDHYLLYHVKESFMREIRINK